MNRNCSLPSTRVAGTLLTCLMLSLGESARAQTVVPTIDTVSRLIAHARGELNRAPGLNVRASQDAFADSLVAIALSAKSRSRGGANAAVVTLSVSGTRGAKNPYGGAAARLLKIALESQEQALRDVATSGIGYLADTTAAISALRRLAVLDNSVAQRAVSYLGNFGVPGLATLRVLYRDSAVREVWARKHLLAFAHDHGWPITKEVDQAVDASILPVLPRRPPPQ